MPTETLSVRNTHVTVTKYGGGMIAASMDDGAEAKTAGGVFTAGNMLVYDTKHGLGRIYGVDWHYGFRFLLPSTGWLDGKNIQKVTLKLTHTNLPSGGSPASFEATAKLENAAIPAELAIVDDNLTDRTLTTGTVTFSSDVINKFSDTTQASYSGDGTTEFTTLLSQVLTTQGAANVGAIMFVIQHVSGTGFRQIYASGFSSSGTYKPELDILYSENVVDLDFKKREIIRNDDTQLRI